MDETLSGDFVNISDTESLLATSQYAQVVFRNILESYDCNKDLECRYTMQNIPQSGDRILLIKLGWQSTTDYTLMEWVSMENDSNDTYTVIFQSKNLPQNFTDFYQFCYVTIDNSICGASIPFRFTSELSSKIDLLSESFEDISESFEDIPQPTTSCADCETTKSDNENLTKTIQALSVSMEDYQKQMNELSKDVEELRRSLVSTQSDVAEFKFRLDQAGEEYKKLYIEKKKTERKYDKLVRKCQARKKFNVDVLDDLEPFPPFPFVIPSTSSQDCIK